MSGFPVNLDLSEYFADLRKYSSVFVNLSKCKDVGDVENHIKSVFKLEDNICLVHKKFLIPKSEDVQILQQYEIFKVQKCNFYDLQIHKTKKGNAVTCDQKALNLTQSEKTIDLSCRPKQRLRANTSPSPGISGTLTYFVDNSKHLDSQITSPTCTTLMNGIQNNSREKQKHKKKRHLQIDESDDETGTDGNILDMSVKNSKRKKHSNCFSTDDGSLKSESAIGNNSTDISRDLQKRFKKRKKHVQHLDDYSVDLASTSWNSLVYDKNGIKDQNSKKKSKKAREDCFNGGSSIDTNNTAVKNELENQVELDNTHSFDNEFSNKKKHKQRKYSESKVLGECQDSQYYSSTPTCTSKSHNPKKSNILKQYYHKKLEEDSDFSKLLEQEKKRLKVEIDQIITQTQNNNLDTNGQNSGDENESIISSAKPSKSESNLEKEGSLPGNDTNQKSCSEFDFANRKMKRKRKHNKKKKKENLMYIYAVGPALNQLATEPTIPRPSTSSVGVKHVFFPEDNSTEEMEIPVTPPIKSQTIPDSSEPLNNHAEVNQTQEQLSPKPLPWQDQLLKLASTNSKPVVFHRHPTVATTNKQVSSSQPNQEHSSGEKPTLSPVQTNYNSSDIQEREINHMVDDIQRSNGDVKTDNNNEGSGSCSGTVNSSNSRKALPDICKPLPIPNDLHNINLTDYPIIDKVVAEDLILFKVLKLGENSEPGVSKPILARVNGTLNFPDRISLQIMEGCEECSHCNQIEGSGDAFIIELRWTDILEPRLFYP